MPAPTRRGDRAAPSAGPGRYGGMDARIGDEIVARGTTTGVVTLDFPGPDACIRHLVQGGDHVRSE
ncbi:hypothetical protein [Streptomyces sp. NPDC002671]